MTGIKLKEVMKIQPFSRAELVGGRGGVDRLVSSANIQEVPDVERWLHGGEILFTAGYAFQTGEKGVQLMTTLEEKGAAALAVKPGTYLPEIPAEMIRYADDHDFPLFLLPGDLPYMDCILPIFHQITQSQIAIMKRNEEIHNRLIQVIVEEQGLKGLCVVLGQMTAGAAAVVSPRGMILALDLGIREEEEPGKEELGVKGQERQGGETQGLLQERYDRYRKELAGRRFSESTPKRMKKNKCNLIYDSFGKQQICIPIFVKNEHIAYLLLDMPEHEASSMDLLAFENASSLIAVELLKEQAAKSEEQKVKEQLLDDLLAKRYGDEEVMLRRGRYVGFDFTKKSCGFILGIDSFEDCLSGRKKMSEKKIQKIKQDMRAELERQFSESRLPALLLGSGMDITGLIQTEGRNRTQNVVPALSAVLRRLASRYGQLDFSVGIGREKAGLEKVVESWNEARYAIKAGRRIKKKEKEPKLTCFEHLGCLCFLCQVEDTRAAADFYDEYMGEIERYDRENEGVLVETLEAYFANGSNLRKTAEALFVHKNSVIYRLGKVESLLGKKLSDNQVLFHLQLCLKLRQIQ